MALKQEFFRNGDKYVALTGESPKQFKGLMFAAFVGDNPESIAETCLMHNQLEKMVRIEGADLPDEWADAFRANGFVIDKPESKPESDEPEYDGDYEEYEPEEYEPPKRTKRKRHDKKLPPVEVKLDFTPSAGAHALIGAFIMLTAAGFIGLSIIQIIARIL